MIAELSILLTAFEPFGGAAINVSRDVAQVIAQDPDLKQRGVQVHVCTLPVVYDLASEAAENCLRALPSPPALILSLGEGPCDIRLETAGTNLDNEPFAADNQGQTRTDQVIEATAPARVGFTLPVQALYCALPDSIRSYAHVSTSAGGFVCNNTAFHLAFDLPPLAPPYGFIHVPPPACGDDVSNPAQNGRAIAQMIAAALDSLATSATPPERQPVSHDEAQARLAALPANAPACARDFLSVF